MGNESSLSGRKSAPPAIISSQKPGLSANTIKIIEDLRAADPVYAKLVRQVIMLTILDDMSRTTSQDEQIALIFFAVAYCAVYTPQEIKDSAELSKTPEGDGDGSLLNDFLSQIPPDWMSLNPITFWQEHKERTTPIKISDLMDALEAGEADKKNPATFASAEETPNKWELRILQSNSKRNAALTSSSRTDSRFS